jgi:hypothetical protein
MPDYSQGKIYQILNTVTDDVYIGSTTQLLSGRMKAHRHDSKLHERKLYMAMRDHDVCNLHIELIEKFPCSCREELNARERYWMRKELPSLNHNIAGRSAKGSCHEY